VKWPRIKKTGGGMGNHYVGGGGLVPEGGAMHLQEVLANLKKGLGGVNANTNFVQSGVWKKQVVNFSNTTMGGKDRIKNVVQGNVGTRKVWGKDGGSH